jgi:hypothetical protein
MARKCQIQGTYVLRRRGDSRLVLCFSLLLTLLLVLGSGCQKSTTTGQTPATQTKQAQTQADKTQEPTTQAAARTGYVDTKTPVEQGVPIQPAAVAVDGPRIALKEAVHDFGDVGPETKHTAQFTFTSVGKAPLKIIQVKSCCGVATKGVKNGQEYAPGQSGTLELEMSTAAYPGDLTRNLYLTTNDPDHKVVTLTLKGKIVRRVDFKPERLRLFLRQDNAGCPELKLTSLDGQPFSITGFKSTANAIKAEFDPAAKATEFTLKPKVDMEKVQRNLRGQISIDVSHPECKNVRVLYDVLPEFTINPPQIMLFNLKANQTIQREIWVLSNYQDDFEVESVTSQKGGVKLLEQKKVGNRYQLKIEAAPPAPADERSVWGDVLEVKIKGGDTLTIPFRGFY